MKFDSQEQKNFVLNCVRKYTCTIEEAVVYLNRYVKDIEAGQIIIVKPVPIKKEAKQDDKDTPDNTPVGTTESESGQEAAS